MPNTQIGDGGEINKKKEKIVIVPVPENDTYRDGPGGMRAPGEREPGEHSDRERR